MAATAPAARPLALLTVAGSRDGRAAVHPALCDALDALCHDGGATARAIAHALHRDGGVLPGDPRTVAGSSRAAQDVIDAFARTVRRGEPVGAGAPVPTARRIARALARAGGGLRELLRLCHIGHGTFLAAWEHELACLELPAPTTVAASQAARELSFAWVDAFAQALGDEHERERRRLARTGGEQRAQTIRAVLAGEVGDQAAMSRALGYDLVRHHTAMVLWLPGQEGDDSTALDDAAARLAGALGAGRPLLLPVSPTVTWAWCATSGPPPPAALRALRVAPAVAVAIGDAAPGAAGFRASNRDAQDAFRVALLAGRRRASVVQFSRVALAAMLAEDLDRTRRFVRAHLRELATDDDHHARLRATLRTFIDELGSRQATGERLGVHANTVGNRINACQAVLGDDLGGRPGELHVALTLAQQLGPAVLD